MSVRLSVRASLRVGVRQARVCASGGTQGDRLAAACVQPQQAAEDRALVGGAQAKLLADLAAAATAAQEAPGLSGRDNTAELAPEGGEAEAAARSEAAAAAAAAAMACPHDPDLSLGFYEWVRSMASGAPSVAGPASCARQLWRPPGELTRWL